MFWYIILCIVDIGVWTLFFGGGGGGGGTQHFVPKSVLKVKVNRCGSPEKGHGEGGGGEGYRLNIIYTHHCLNIISTHQSSLNIS